MSRYPICPACDQIHTGTYALARHRFGPPDKVRYRARTAPDAPERMTRAEAAADECAWRAHVRQIRTSGQETS